MLIICHWNGYYQILRYDLWPPEFYSLSNQTIERRLTMSEGSQKKKFYKLRRWFLAEVDKSTRQVTRGARFFHEQQEE